MYESNIYLSNVFSHSYIDVSPSLSCSPNAVLRLRFNHFATECSWDHMYVYDGDSIYAPLIAVFRWAACYSEWESCERSGWVEKGGGGGGEYGNDSGSLWHSFKKPPLNLHLCSQLAPRRKTMGLVITIVPQTPTDKREEKNKNKKKTEITHISLECWFCFWSFCCIFSPCFFSLNNLQGRVGGTLSFDRNSLKNTNTTIIYKPPTVYSAPLRLISCWEFSCSQDIKDYIPTDEKKKNLVFEHTKPRLGVGLLPAINKAYVVHYKCSCCSREGALSHYGCGYICGALHSL